MLNGRMENYVISRGNCCLVFPFLVTMVFISEGGSADHIEILHRGWRRVAGQGKNEKKGGIIECRWEEELEGQEEVVCLLEDLKLR